MFPGANRTQQSPAATNYVLSSDSDDEPVPPAEGGLGLSFAVREQAEPSQPMSPLPLSPAGAGAQPQDGVPPVTIHMPPADLPVGPPHAWHPGMRDRVVLCCDHRRLDRYMLRTGVALSLVGSLALTVGSMSLVEPAGDEEPPIDLFIGAIATLAPGLACMALAVRMRSALGPAAQRVRDLVEESQAAVAQHLRAQANLEPVRALPATPNGA